MTTTTEQLTYIRSKCVEAVPGILDLKLGCEVKCLFEGQKTKGFITDNQDSYGQITVQIPNFYSVNKEVETLEIIGRPIQLSDVLLAILNCKNAIYPIELVSRDGGSILLGADNPVITQDVARWNLLETLDHQSPETLLFIYELLYE